MTDPGSVVKILLFLIATLALAVLEPGASFPRKVLESIASVTESAIVEQVVSPIPLAKNSESALRAPPYQDHERFGERRRAQPHDFPDRIDESYEPSYEPDIRPGAPVTPSFHQWLANCSRNKATNYYHDSQNNIHCRREAEFTERGAIR